MINHAADELLDFRGQGLALGQLLKLLPETLTLQRLAPIRVRRTTRRIVPRRLIRPDES
jgi:hypothetical protein